jgi:anti-sigma factor RsiW
MIGHISEEQISAWVDRQLDPGETRQIEDHLRDCAECRAAADDMSAIAEVFRSAETAELPPYLWSRIATHLESETSPQRSRVRSWFMPAISRPLWTRAAAAILAVAILAAGGALYVEHKSAADLERRALAEMQLAQNSLVALGAESYNPFRTAGAAYREENPFSRDRVRPEINPFRSAGGDR